MSTPPALDEEIARRGKQAVERFAQSGAGNVKRLQGTHLPELRLCSVDWRVRFQLQGNTIHVLHVRNRKEAYR